MSNFQLKLDFLKFKNACVISIKGKKESKKGVFIPIEDNNIFVSAGDNDKAKSLYIDLVAFETKNVGKYGDTHMIKQSLGKDEQSNMSEDEKRAMPILGNMKPMKMQKAAQTVDAPVTPIVQEEDDLQF